MVAMNTKVTAVQTTRSFQKCFVVLCMLVGTMVTFYSIEQSSIPRQAPLFQEARRFTFVHSSARTDTSHRKESKSHIVGKDGVQPKQLVFPYYHNQLPNAYIHPSNDTIYQNSVVVFVHNPKSGGSTIKDCMKRLLPQKPVLMSIKEAHKIREYLLNGDAPLRPYYMGDSSIGVCDYGRSRPCSYFTMLREPYERAVSNYYHCKDRGNCKYSSNNSLEEFVLSSCSLFFHQLTLPFNCHESESENCTRRQVCSTSWHCNSGRATSHVTKDQRETVLQYVIDHLDTTFAVIGLLDEYESSLELFEDTLGVNFVDKCRTLHQNTGGYLYRENNSSNGDKQSRRMLIDTAVKRLRENENVRECLSEDEKIYNRAKEIFEIQRRELLKKKLWKS